MVEKATKAMLDDGRHEIPSHPHAAKPSRDKGSMRGRNRRCRPAYEISRKVIEDTWQRIAAQTYTSLN